MKLSALLAPLLDAKADHEMIRAMVLAYESEQADALEHRRKMDAERQARKRERDASSRDVTLRHSDRSLVRGRDARVEDKTSNTDIEPQKKDKDTPLARLEVVLDHERAAAVVDHRKRIRKPLTAHGAKVLAGKFAKCPDPNAAADAMVSNGWQGFEPSWMEPKARGSPGPKRGMDAFLGEFGDYLDGQTDGKADHGPTTGVVLSLPASTAKR